MTKPLFPITLEPTNDLLLNIIGTLDQQIEYQNNFVRMRIEQKPDREQRTKSLNDLERNLKELQQTQDVLETVRNHNDDICLMSVWNEKRHWKNEWDIPETIFASAMDLTVSILQDNQKKNSERKDEYETQIGFLRALKHFRLS